MKKWIWVLILLQATLILSCCSAPIAITASVTGTKLPVLKTDTPEPQVSPTKTKTTIIITKTLTSTKVNTPVILFTPNETLTALDKKRRYEARISNQQMKMIAMAIDEYFSDKGIYPEKLENLIPEYLDKIPDTITGQEIHFEISTEYRYVLFFDLLYWDKTVGCGFLRGPEAYECSPHNLP